MKAIIEEFNNKYPEAVVTINKKSCGNSIVCVNGKSAFNCSGKGWYSDYMVRMEYALNR